MSLSINCICLVINNALIIMYNFLVKFWTLNKMLIFLKAKKNILKAIFILVSANKKVFLINPI